MQQLNVIIKTTDRMSTLDAADLDGDDELNIYDLGVIFKEK